jgi:hypothetical protein
MSPSEPPTNPPNIKPSEPIESKEANPDEADLAHQSQDAERADAKKPKVALSGRVLMLAILLLAGILVVYSPQFAPTLWSRAQPVASANADKSSGAAYSYIADLDFWQRTDREIQVFTNARFDLNDKLTDVPLDLGDWHGQEVPENNQEVMILLDPEQYVQRLYQNSKGQYMWLSMIGGRSSQPFHAPDICYDADGWQYNLSSESIPLDGGGEVHGLWMQASKVFPGDTEKTEQIVFYFYLFPNQSRELKDGIVLFKLTSARYGTLEDTLKIHADFVRQLFKRAQAPGV